MEAEMESIRASNTWDHATLPAGHRAIGLKWVFKVKRDPAGNIVNHKARLVAKGYAQRQGVDFDEVFAPVGRLETVGLLLAVAAQRQWTVHHMDVRLAFLNCELEEEVYVHQPAGFVDGGNAQKVLKLRKALYGVWTPAGTTGLECQVRRLPGLSLFRALPAGPCSVPAW